MARLWSDDEVKLLMKLVQNKTQREIAQRLGRSMKSVERKLHGMRHKKARIQSIPAWSDDELELLKRLFPIKTAQEVAERVGRSVRSVRAKAYKMGLQRTVVPWSKDEVRLLKELYSHNSKTVIADKLGRSVSSIAGKAHKLGLKRTERYRHWSEHELDTLRELFSHRKSHLVASRLGRSMSSVTSKACELGLKKTSTEQYRHWPERELDMLRKLFSHKDRQLVADKLGRSVSSVTYKAYQLGLKKTNEPTKSVEQY